MSGDTSMRGEHAVLPWPDAVGTHHADDIRAPVLRELIARMARENPLWGIPRIRAELALLGHGVARSTVAKYAGREFGPPSQTWSAFIRNHMNSTAAMDFFTVPTVTGGWLYGFILLAHDRRRILHYNVTRFPTASWVARQLVQAFPFDTAPRFLIHDNDGIFGEEMSRTLRLLKIEEVRTSPGSPWMNAYVERFIGSIRREGLDHVIVFNERHPRHQRLVRVSLGSLVPLRCTRLAQRLARPTLRQVRDGALHTRHHGPQGRRAQSFPSRASFRICLSSVSSATAFFSRRFS